MKRLGRAELLAEIAAAPAPACLMCTLARGESLAASEHAVAILDRYAARPGHVLVIARRHEERIAALAYAEYEDLHRLAYRVCRGIEAAIAPRRIYVAALGSAEPLAMSCPHVHLHVVPLRDGGEADRPAEVFTWAHGAYVFESAAEHRAMHAALAAAIAA